MPDAIKIDPAVPKRALNGRIPEAIYRRRKQSFTFPWPKWLRNQLRSLGEEAVNDETTYRALGIDPGEVRRLWGAFQSDRPGITWPRMWSLIVLREWAMRNLGPPTESAEAIKVAMQPWVSKQ